MYGQNRFNFRSNAELRAYYESKYANGGYEGFKIRGYDVSTAYHWTRFERVRAAVARVKPKRLLDVGCGTGVLISSLGFEVPEAVGIDIAANAFPSPHRLGVTFRQMNAEEMDFRGGQFDMVVCVETLEHVLEPRRVLREIKRVLQPGGTFFLTYPLVNRTFFREWHLAPKLKFAEHLSEWSHQELVAACENVGFRVEAVEGFVFDFGPGNLLKYLSGSAAKFITNCSIRLRPPLGNSMFVQVVCSLAC